jgi:hypothetical protein
LRKSRAVPADASSRRRDHVTARYSAWLLTLVRNDAIDRLRASGRTLVTARTHMNSTTRARTPRQPPAVGPSCLELQLEGALDALPQLQRQTIALVYTHDLRASEAAHGSGPHTCRRPPAAAPGTDDPGRSHRGIARATGRARSHASRGRIAHRSQITSISRGLCFTLPVAHACEVF